MALYAIGDIHGSFFALEDIFRHGHIQKDDLVVFLGDYVDRGHEVKGVFDWLIENQKHYRFEFLLGNHEIMMQTARTDPENFEWWQMFGGKETLQSYGLEGDPDWAEKVNPAHWEFMDACKPYLEVEDFIFVHGGLEAGKPLSEQNDHHLYWKKYEVPEMYLPDKKVICGHTSRKNGEIANFGHTVCIDTFAHGGMWLSCLNVETGEFVQANNYGEVKKGLL